jgi:hypothetical protein
MRRQSIPNQQHRTLLNVVQEAQELDKRFVVISTRTQLKNEVSVAAIGFIRQGTGQ